MEAISLKTVEDLLASPDERVELDGGEWRVAATFRG
jgi:hypothetical protein